MIQMKMIKFDAIFLYLGKDLNQDIFLKNLDNWIDNEKHTSVIVDVYWEYSKNTKLKPNEEEGISTAYLQAHF